jgi:predicted nucleotidyltransferase
MSYFNLDKHKDALERYFASLREVVLAYLFGSHARGQAWAHSDVDVAVLLEDDDGDRCFDVRLEVNQAPPALRYAVLRDGILLFCRDHRARIEFHLRTVNEYLDFKPILERHERAILEKARKGELLDGYNPHRGTLERYQRLRERLAGTSSSDVR